MRKIFILFSIVLVLSSCAQYIKKYPFRNISLSTEKRVGDLLSRLTVEEKVALMMNQNPAIERLSIPAYDWWNEALHGVARAGRATVFPQAIAMAATFDDKAVYETFDIISDEARAKYHNYQNNKEYERYKGLTSWTPNINIFRDPRWGRGMETYGEDPYLASRMGVAVVKGLQGDDPKYFKTLACAKHFAVHSGPEWSRHSLNVSVSSRDLLETYLPSFEDYSMKDRTYRYMTSEPLYPFGYGLSYSKFTYSDVSLSNSEMDINSSVSLDLSVANDSKYDGDEVIQVYVKRVEDKEGPIKTLKAFKRVPVKTMSKNKVLIKLENKVFMTYDESTQSMKVLPGNYRVIVGSSSMKQDLTTVPLIIK